MTWIRIEEMYSFVQRCFGFRDTKVVDVALFYCEETGEVKSFLKSQFEQVGEQGILKILNSPTPASSQSGE